MPPRAAAIVAVAALGVTLVMTSASEPAARGPLGAPCDPHAERPAVNGSIELSLYRGEGVTEAKARELAADVASYFETFALAVSTTGAVQELPYDAMLVRPREADDRADARDQATQLLARLGEFVRRHAAAPDGAIRVVVLSSIAEPGSAAEARLGKLRGLALSPAFLPTERPRFDVRDVLGDRHAPVILVAPRGDAPSDARVLAHEIGHVLGLEHRHHPHNLMTQHEHGCAPTLDAEQAEGMRRSLAAIEG